MIHEGIAQRAQPLFVIFEVDGGNKKRGGNEYNAQELIDSIASKYGLKVGNIEIIGEQTSSGGTRFQVSVELGSELVGMGAWLDPQGNIHFVE